MQLFASGIFMWLSPERRSGRYGYFYPSDCNFEENVNGPVYFDSALCEKMNKKRVKITILVKEARVSGHQGDAFLQITPTMPQVGEKIVLGVGIFDFNKVYQYSPIGYTFGLKPSKYRDDNWIDPRTLYRLHDQTVEMYIEETEEPDSPIPRINAIAETGAIVNEGGSLQVRTRSLAYGTTIEPNINYLGDGVYEVVSAGSGKPGDLFKIR